MEEIIANRVTPVIKCMVLFLLIFTAKVLTSRPHESQDSKNGIQHGKAPQYVRTFTKYHHRRTIQWNSFPETDWQLTEDEKEKVVEKRSVDFMNKNEYVEIEQPVISEYSSDTKNGNDVSENKKEVKFGLTDEMKKYKIKAMKVFKETTTTMGPTISCLYKIHKVALSATPSYDDDIGQTVETESLETPGPLSKITLKGEEVEVEQCTEPRASCYTLLYRSDDGNITVLGQGCWHASQPSCDKCTKVTPLLPGTKFCCCSKNYCNADFLSLKDEIVTPQAELKVSHAPPPTNYSNIIAAAILTLVAILVLSVTVRKLYCIKPQPSKEDLSDGADIEKGEVMGSGPDALATGLTCVDNLTLIEHIGQGKFGSVWRGSLGSAPVAVKLYANPSAWMKEISIYSLPHLAHPNILKYYGSDTRATLTGSGREHLIVVELCTTTLRRRLEEAPLSWNEFAHLAHGVASALAHMHSLSPQKCCIVHRDVNSSNVLICGNDARLADLGLAHALMTRPAKLAEAGTLRYLAPEALEGALDLSGAKAALCAVDVYALGLVLWEMLWRTSGAHIGNVPVYCAPYQHSGLPNRPSLAQMQSLVSRKKMRPPLPKGPVTEQRALTLSADTCDECWDHDAEARLTAFCVEERMSELKHLLNSPGPLIHENNLHPDQPDANIPSIPENDKPSNCLILQNCDVTTPLLYTQPHIGRNPCLERNTHVTQTHTVELIHKSLKDIQRPASQRVANVENTLSVARPQNINDNIDRLNEIRSYQRPIDYVLNDVSVHEKLPKQTNLEQEKQKWGFKKFFQNKLQKKGKLETEVKLVENVSNGSNDNGKIRTSLVNEKINNIPYKRPSNIILEDDKNLYLLEAPCLSPPNRTLSPTMIIESDLNRENNGFGFKELPSRVEDTDRHTNQIFAVIVPKAKPTDFKISNLIERRATSSSDSLKNSFKTSISSQSIINQSESEDSTIKKRLSDLKTSDPSNSGHSSRASINLELQFIDNQNGIYENDSAFDINSDCSSSDDEQLMLLSENGSKITMHPIKSDERRKNEVLKESSQTKTDFTFNKFQNKYSSFDNEFSDPNDKENLVYSGDNPVYLATINGEIENEEVKLAETEEKCPKSPKPSLKNLAIKRQHSLEQVSEIFCSSGDIHLQNPAGRVKTPGDLPVAIRKARRDRALQKGRAYDSNRLSLYDDRMMFGNSL